MLSFLLFFIVLPGQRERVVNELRSFGRLKDQMILFELSNYELPVVNVVVDPEVAVRVQIAQYPLV